MAQIVEGNLPVNTQNLENALAMISEGKRFQASKQMEAFINMIEATNDKQIPEEARASLIGYAKTVQTALKAQGLTVHKAE